MKKVLAILVIIIIGAGACNMMNSGPSKEEMIEVLKSQEAIGAIERAIHNREEKALTSEGVIKEYIIEYNDVSWSPMGGIKVIITVNNNEKLKLYYTLNKHNGSYIVGGSHASNELSSLLENHYEK